MKLRFLFGLLLLAAPGWAQVTITQNDMPRAGDTLRYSEANPGQFFLPVASGAAQTWDYSALVPEGQGVAQYKSALSVGAAYALFFGLNAYGRLVADTLDAGGLQATDYYEFYRRSAASFSTVGAGVTYNGITIPANYSDPDEVYSFPLTYQRRDSTRYRVQFSVPGLGSLTRAGTRTNTVIGYGNITTPYGTYASLLLRSVDRRNDTLLPAQIPFPIAIPSVTISYQWLAVGQRLPILDVTVSDDFGLETVTQVRYRDIRRVVVAPAPRPDFLAFRTQVDVGDSVNIFNLTSPPTGNRYLWSLAPATGWRFAAGTSAANANPVVAFSQPGLYSVTLTASNAGSSADTTKPDYIEVQDPNGTRPRPLAGALLWPSPTRDRVTVHLPPGTPQPTHLLAVSTEGRVVRLMLSAQGQAEVRGLAPGAYRVYLPSGPLVGGFVKE